MTTTKRAAPAADPTETPAAPAIPVVGRRRPGVVPKRVSFVLCSYDGRDRETEHQLTARGNLDTSTVFSFTDKTLSPGERVSAIQSLLSRVLVDDDGISVNAFPEAVRQRKDDESDNAEDDAQDDGPGADLVPVDGDDDLALSDLADVQWRIEGSDELFASASLALQFAHSSGSSLRRFAALMDDRFEIVEQEALEGIVDLIVAAAADRPTGRSSGSRASRRRAGR